MSSERPVVFVVDDDASVRTSLSLLIESAGWLSETFATAHDLLARLPAREPSCLVIDVVLPDLDGCDLQALIASRAEMPVIFISGHRDSTTTVRAMKAGALAFLTKPFDGAVFLDAVRNAFDRSFTWSGQAPTTTNDRTTALNEVERDVVARVVSGRLNMQVGYERTVGIYAGQPNAVATLSSIEATARLQERVWERERIARELHDTLLQGTEALLLAVHAVLARMRCDDPAHEMLTHALRRADEVMTQGRDRIQSLRATNGAPIDLRKVLRSAWTDLGGAAELKIHVQGQARDFEPDIGDEIALIGREALINAHRHSRASLIEASLVYEADEFRLRVADDGIGLPEGVHRSGSLSGHWGLPGMRERARRISGDLFISSTPGAGTAIELVVPAKAAHPMAVAWSATLDALAP